MTVLPIDPIQAFLRERDLDGWLLWDFRGQNPVARALLGFDRHLLTRRWACFVPDQGEAVILVHRIERGSLPCTKSRRLAYGSHGELHAGLRQILSGRRRIAMEYVPFGAIPHLSRVDAGTIELVRSFGVEVVSSADLVQHFLCRLDDEQIRSHARAAVAIDRIKDEAFAFAAERIRSGRPALETEIQALVSSRFDEAGLVTDHPCVVAVNDHTADPHFVPRPNGVRPCDRGDLLLIDLWAKENDPRAVYADITWTAFAGDDPPGKILEVFRAVTGARDAGLARVETAFRSGERLEGWMVDREVRDFLAARGFGDSFIHRTGHNIGANAVHGDGAHLDDYETHDTRELVPGLCFSIEPGVYLAEFGIRSEIDVVLEEAGPRVFGPIQRELVRLEV